MQGGESRAALGAAGRGPESVITDKAIFGFHAVTREMQVISLHPGVTLAEVQEVVSWPLQVAAELTTTPPPTAEEMAILRGELDVAGRFR
jgi:glutaconate CoA-transferase subunit B